MASLDDPGGSEPPPHRVEFCGEGMHEEDMHFSRAFGGTDGPDVGCVSRFTGGHANSLETSADERLVDPLHPSPSSSFRRACALTVLPQVRQVMMMAVGPDMSPRLRTSGRGCGRTLLRRLMSIGRQRGSQKLERGGS